MNNEIKDNIKRLVNNLIIAQSNLTIALSTNSNKEEVEYYRNELKACENAFNCFLDYLE